MFDSYSNFLKLVVLKCFIIRTQIQEKLEKKKASAFHGGKTEWISMEKNLWQVNEIKLIKVMI